MSLLEALIWLVSLPFETGKQLDEESLVGQSDWDRRSRSFWRRVAWVVTLLIFGVALAFYLIFFG